MTRRIAVIGGGWAGCAAAVELAQKGYPVTLFESARLLGGRARAVEINGLTLDNGQHILLGAYSETLRMMRITGTDPADVLLRLPLQMRYPANSGGMDFVTPHLPAPLHLLFALLRARGLAREDKLALARFSTTARWMDWQLHTDCSVAELLERFDQTDRLIRLMWRPLCIAALNTPPERASAQVFLNVLRDSLGARRAASDMLIPRADLTGVFPKQAGTFVEQRGSKVLCGTTIARIEQDGTGWRLQVTSASGMEHAQFDGVVIATQASHAADLLGAFVDVSLPTFEYEPISTCYLQYAQDFRLAQPFYALLDDAAREQWGQFVFDRGQLDPKHAGLLSVVVSASSEAIAAGHDALAKAIASQLATALQEPALTRPQWVKVISEKRATFSCSPALARPANRTAFKGLAIAGDYTASDYPATLESAVRSGVRAANCLIG